MKKEKNKFSKKTYVILLSSLLLIFYSYSSYAKEIKNFKSTALYETRGINIDQRFQFTISPNNKWLLYFEKKYPYDDRFNLIVLNTLTKKKYTIDTKNVNTTSLQLQIQNGCWSKNSKYCVLPVGIPRTDQRMIERMKSIQVAPTSSWIQGILLGESEFADDGGAVGFPNNAPDIIIDLSDGDSPKLKTQYFDYTLVDPSHQHRFTQPVNKRLTFDNISPGGFTCSDCSHTMIEKDFGNDEHGYVLVSPDGRYIATTVSKGTTWVTPPKLYIEDTKNKEKKFIASNVYYDMHFTSDSKRLYYYGCYSGGACNQNDSLSYVDLIPNPYPSEKKSVFSTKPMPAEQDREKDLQTIIKKEEDAKNKILKAHYDIFTNDFLKPVKVIGINGSRFYTENNRMVSFVVDEHSLGEKQDQYISILKSLIGKTVKVTLPPFEEFIKTYKDESSYDVFHGNYSLYAIGIDGQNVLSVTPAPSDPLYHKYFGQIYANVYFEGVLINDKFK